MRHGWLLGSIVLWLASALLAGCPLYEGLSPPGAGENAVTQYSTIDALLMGQYDGDLRLGQLRRYGDFGLGTFNALDGEMAVLDGVVYQIRSDGAVLPMEDNVQTPFAAVTFFRADTPLDIAPDLDFAALEAAVTAQLPSKNLFCAIRIDGAFPYIKTRSVPKQSPPYRPLSEVVPEQSVFEFENVTGTLLGFYCPAYADKINVAGYHFHFLTSDRKAGGHVLALTTGAVNGALDQLYTLTMLAPNRAAFLDADLDGDGDNGLGEVERDRAKAFLPF
jgi:acetolactate decarboxylase